MSKKKILYFTIALSLVLIVGIFALSVRDMLRYPGVDLRCKVVPARLLLAHLNPYPDPSIAEPNEHYRMFDESTGSPVLLLLFYAPFSRLPYGSQRMIYFALDWLCVAYLFVQTRLWFPPSKRAVHCLLFTLFVIADFSLRLHLERGQCYLEIAALAAIAISAWRKGKSQSGWIGALALAILVAIRPTFLIVVPVLWLQGFSRQVRRTISISAIICVLMLVTFGIQPWIGYDRTVSRMQQLYVHVIFTPGADPYPFVKLATGPYQKVEGEDFSRRLTTSYFVPRSLISFCALQERARPFAARIFKTPRVFTAVNNGFLVLGVIYCLLFGYVLRNRATDVKLGFAFLAPVVIESFGPKRHAYCDVILAPILMLILANMLQVRAWGRLRERATLFVVVIVCALSSFVPMVFPVGVPIAALSIGRWVVLFLWTNTFFVRAALEPAKSLICESPFELETSS